MAVVTAYTLGYDSTQLGLIPRDAAVVFYYPDGRYAASAAAVRAQCPNAFLQPLTVRGGAFNGIDFEPGNAEPDPLDWLLDVATGYRPVTYADLSDLVDTILPRFEEHFETIPPPGPARPFRLLAAHPNGVEHICGPHTCGELPVDADGTQYLWNPRNVNIDISALLPSFTAPAPIPQPPGDTEMVAPYETSDGRTGFVVETAAGEILHIEQQNAPGKGDSDFWRNANGTPNWLSLGTPGAAG